MHINSCKNAHIHVKTIIFLNEGAREEVISGRVSLNPYYKRKVAGLREEDATLL